MNEIFLRCLAGMLLSLVAHSPLRAEVFEVQMHAVTPAGEGALLGTVVIHDTRNGMMIMPDLKGLSPGSHGFHIHENPDCGPAEKDGQMQAALKAGEHLDPANTGKHEGPTGKGHLGDLPVLEVASDGSATKSIDITRLKVRDIKNRSLVIHESTDNYSDIPKPMGGSGGRIACGVIK